MKIEVYSLTKVLREVEKGNVQHLVSIRDRYCDPETQEKYDALDRRAIRYGVDMKVIYFDDIDTYRFKHGMENPWIQAKFADGTKEPIFFGVDHAKDIVDGFVRPLWEADPNVKLTVHCWAGRSRSQAVAYYLNIYFNLVLARDVEAYVENNAKNLWEKIHFNCDVLKVMTQVYG